VIASLVSERYADVDIIEAFGKLPASQLSYFGINLAQLRDALPEIAGGASWQTTLK
jgi:hypothetical protein